MHEVAPREEPDAASQPPGLAEGLVARARNLVGTLLLPENESQLEQFRFPGSTNKVYLVPLGPDTDEFIVLKLPPGRWVSWSKLLKCRLRNLVYGEHDIAIGEDRVALEIERYREWASEGLLVPQLIQTPIPQARVVRGLPYPTLYTFLSSPDVPTEEKLRALGPVTRSLAHQHKTALERGRKGLVHTYPGPWNMLFDSEKETTYWYDLEHPAEYPRMTIEDLIVRALRIFLYGVLDHFPDRIDEVLRTVTLHYEPKRMLWGLAESLSPDRASLALRLLYALRLKRRNMERRREIARRLTDILDAQEPR